MIQTLITCDSCGFEDRGEYPAPEPGAYWTHDVIGGGWAEVSINWLKSRRGSPVSDAVAQICPTCVHLLTERLGVRMANTPPATVPVPFSTSTTASSTVLTTSTAPLSSVIFRGST